MRIVSSRNRRPEKAVGVIDALFRDLIPISIDPPLRWNPIADHLSRNTFNKSGISIRLKIPRFDAQSVYLSQYLHTLPETHRISVFVGANCVMARRRSDCGPHCRQESQCHWQRLPTRCECKKPCFVRPAAPPLGLCRCFGMELGLTLINPQTCNICESFQGFDWSEIDSVRLARTSVHFNFQPVHLFIPFFIDAQ